MKQINILNDDILIANFMDFDKSFIDGEWLWDTGFTREHGGDDWSSLYTAEELLFKQSWSWIMQVIYRIENKLKEKFCVVISEETCRIFKITRAGRKTDCFMLVADGFETTKIASVYTAIINFINWYNNK